MAQEIERKWLIPALPEDFDTSGGETIEQGYLTIAAGGDETRVRAKGASYTLTTKSGSGLVRGETEITLTEAQFRQLWPATEGARVSKVRYAIPAADGLTLEVDVYRGALQGLIVAEVEFPDSATAEQFGAPVWFGPEVTADSAYKNHSLAVHGRP